MIEPGTYFMSFKGLDFLFDISFGPILNLYIGFELWFGSKSHISAGLIWTVCVFVFETNTFCAVKSGYICLNFFSLETSEE